MQKRRKSVTEEKARKKEGREGGRKEGILMSA